MTKEKQMFDREYAEWVRLINDQLPEGPWFRTDARETRAVNTPISPRT